jgi:hypothetical protein
MKRNNFKLASMDAALKMLHRISLAKLQSSAANKQLRQDRDIKRRQSWAQSTNGARECARRRQQVAYDAGLVSRRALPQDWKSVAV